MIEEEWIFLELSICENVEEDNDSISSVRTVLRTTVFEERNNSEVHKNTSLQNKE